MDSLKFSSLKNEVQEIINLIGNKNYNSAHLKLIEVNEYLDELIDLSAEDDDLIEISRYQVLLNHLQQKVNSELHNN